MSPKGRQLILGLGSNLGDRPQNIADAITALSLIPGTQVLACSQVIDTDPVGFQDQGNFLNCCIAIICNLDAGDLLQKTLGIELALGRVRTENKNGPRVIDIDLLFDVAGECESTELTLPHPRWKERGFVVIPLRQLLQEPTLANHREWISLKAEVDALTIGGAGLRVWQGPTPWIKTQP